MKRLPLGIQTFRKIIQKELLYVDKTREILNLLESGESYFISRPRRFGKSLLISTLKEIFSGNKELFQGLYIYDKHDWKKHPVIHLDFSLFDYGSGEELKHSLIVKLTDINKEYNLNVKKESLGIYFEKIITSLYSQKGYGAVILIDEYDKPIIDYVSDPAKAETNRMILKDFYSVLKGLDEYLRFVFITGVSKFSKVSIFSGLNNLEDITFDNRFSSLLGITEGELDTCFTTHIKELAKNKMFSESRIKAKIKEWYNGYSWNGVDRLYNPASLFNLFTKKHFSNYWFASGTPAFLMNVIKRKKIDITHIDNRAVGEYIFDNYDLNNMDMYALLLQTGYLTINKVVKVDEYNQYQLTYPNLEVKQSFLNYLLASFINEEVALIQPVYLQLLHSLKELDIKGFTDQLKALFAKIPYTLHMEKEAYYHSLFYMILTLMGANIDMEVLTDKGRIDAVLYTDDKIFVIEFKIGTAERALQQIKERKYYERFLDKKKQVILLGAGMKERDVRVCVEELTRP